MSDSLEVDKRVSALAHKAQVAKILSNMSIGLLSEAGDLSVTFSMQSSKMTVKYTVASFDSFVALLASAPFTVSAAKTEDALALLNYENTHSAWGALYLAQGIIFFRQSLPVARGEEVTNELLFRLIGGAQVTLDALFEKLTALVAAQAE